MRKRTRRVLFFAGLMAGVMSASQGAEQRVDEDFSWSGAVPQGEPTEHSHFWYASPAVGPAACTVQDGALRARLDLISAEANGLIVNQRLRLPSGSLEQETALSIDFQVQGIPAEIRQGPWVGLAFNIQGAGDFTVLRLRFGRESQYQVLQFRDGAVSRILGGTHRFDQPLEYGKQYRLSIAFGGERAPGIGSFTIAAVAQPDLLLNRVTEFADDSPESMRSGYAGLYVPRFPADGATILVSNFSAAAYGSVFAADAPAGRNPLDFTVRPMMFDEHVYTHYFPEATWETGIQALRTRLAVLPMAPRPRLFPGLDAQRFDELPTVVRRTIVDRARGMITQGSANYLDLNTVGKVEAGAAHARFMNQQLLDLLAAWKITGETRYAEYAENFCRALLVAYPPRDEDLATASAPGMDPHAVGELLQGLAMAYDLLYERFDPEFRVEFAATAARYMQIQLTRTRASYGVQGPDRGRSNWWVPYHNWTAIVGGSMGMLALAIEGEVEGLDVYPALWTAASSVEKWLDKGFDPNGAYLEGNHYIQFALAYTLPFMQALKARSGADLFASVKQEKMLEYMTGELLPGNRPLLLNAWNSSHYQGLRWDYVPLLLAGEYESPLGVWVWENALQLPSLHPLTAFYYPVGMHPSDPVEAGVPLVQIYPRRGMANLRTGWSADDLMFSFSSGPFFPTTHGQSDENSFHLYAFGEMLATEHSGRSRPAYTTAAHNAILINGRGQASSSGSNGVDGRLVAFGEHPAYAYLRGDAKSAYDRNTHGGQGVRVGRADRHVLYVKAPEATDGQGPLPYFILYDDIQQHYGESDYSWLLHTGEGNRISLDLTATMNQPELQAVYVAGNRGRLDLFFFGPNKPSVSVEMFEGHPRLKADVRAVKPDFLALLLPLKPQDAGRVSAVRSLSGSGFSGGVVEWRNGIVDLIAVDTGEGIGVPGIETDAHLLHIRRDGEGRVTSWSVVDARRLQVGDRTLLEEKEPVSRMANETEVSAIAENPYHALPSAE